MSTLGLWDISCTITLLKMGVESPSLSKFPLMEVLNIWVFSTYIEPVIPCGMRIYWLPILVGDTEVPPIRTGKFSKEYLTEILQWFGVLPSLPVLLTWPGIRRDRALLRAASVMTSLVWGVARLIVDAPEVATLLSIWGSIDLVMIGRVRLINNFCCKFLLIVSVTLIFFRHYRE